MTGATRPESHSAERAQLIEGVEPAEPVRRYECEHPGELIHIIKKLGRLADNCQGHSAPVMAIYITTTIGHLRCGKRAARRADGNSR
jgi:hypothetical protein